MWPTLTTPHASSPRTEMLYNIGTGGSALRIGKYKLLRAANASWDKRPLPPSAHSADDNSESNDNGSGSTDNDSTLSWATDPSAGDKAWVIAEEEGGKDIQHLFDLEADPNEHVNLYSGKLGVRLQP